MRGFGFPTGVGVSRGGWGGGNDEFEGVEEIIYCFVVGFDEPGGERVSCGGVAMCVTVVVRFALDWERIEKIQGRRGGREAVRKLSKDGRHTFVSR